MENEEPLYASLEEFCEAYGLDAAQQLILQVQMELSYQQWVDEQRAEPSTVH